MASRSLKGSTVQPLPTGQGSIVDVFKKANVGSDVESENNGSVVARNEKTGLPEQALGVFAAWPGCTPKYMRHEGPRKSDYLGTMSRMYVRLRGKSKGRYKSLLNSMPDLETRQVAEVLFGGRYQNDAGKADGAYAGGQGYVDFLLQQADHSTQEKFSVSEVLSDNYVSFFFGQQAPLFTYRGMLMNTYQDDWAMRMNRLFRSIARGTQLARRGLLLYLRYDSVLVSGSLVALNMTHRAESETGVPFSFQLLVKKMHIMYGALGVPTTIPAGNPFVDPNYVLKETVYNSIAPKVSQSSTKSGESDLVGSKQLEKPKGTQRTAVAQKKVDATVKAQEVRLSENEALLADFGVDLPPEQSG